MIRRFWLLVGLLGFIAGVANAGWIYGFGADGGYIAQNGRKSNANMQLSAHGRFGYGKVGRGALFVLGDMGKRIGDRFFGDAGLGFRVGTLELRAYDAWDFGAHGNALHAGTGALSFALSRWHLGLYGYAPLGRSYAARYTHSVAALNKVTGSKYLQRGTEQTFTYDVALKGGEGHLWYTAPVRGEGTIRLGVGVYYLTRDADVLGKTEAQVGPSLDAGWDFAQTSALRVGIYGHYAYDKVLGQQVGFRLSFGLQGGSAVGEFLGLRHGVPTGSFVRRFFVADGSGGGNGDTFAGDGGNRFFSPKNSIVVVNNIGEFKAALQNGEKNIIVNVPLYLSHREFIPRGVTLCGGIDGYCGGVHVIPPAFGVITAPGDALRLGPNTTLENIAVVSDGVDGRWHNAMDVNPLEKDLGTITLRDVGFHGLLFFVQNVPGGKAVYDIRNLKILTKAPEALNNDLSFPGYMIESCNRGTSIQLKDVFPYQVYNGSEWQEANMSGFLQSGGLVTIGSFYSSFEVRELSMLSDTGSVPLQFHVPLVSIYAPSGGKVGAIDLGSVHLQLVPADQKQRYPTVILNGGPTGDIYIPPVYPKLDVEALTLPRLVYMQGGLPNRTRAAVEIVGTVLDAMSFPGTGPTKYISVNDYTPAVLAYVLWSNIGKITLSGKTYITLHTFLRAPRWRTNVFSFVRSTVLHSMEISNVTLECGRVDLPHGGWAKGCRNVAFVQLGNYYPDWPMTALRRSIRADVFTFKGFNFQGTKFWGVNFLRVVGGFSISGFGNGQHIGFVSHIESGGSFLKDHYTCFVTDMGGCI